MSEQDTGNATDTGAQDDKAKETPQAQTVPYARFKEVVDARKAAEESLAAVVDEIVATLPPDMLDLVPNLPPAEKIRWINSARQKGVFAKASGGDQETDSPGSKRPGAKPPQDLSGMNPVQLMSMGYSRQ
jgi:hypothetical protein